MIDKQRADVARSQKNVGESGKESTICKSGSRDSEKVWIDANADIRLLGSRDV